MLRILNVHNTIVGEWCGTGYTVVYIVGKGY